MKKSLFIICIFFCLSLNAQERIILVVDSLTNLPITDVLLIIDQNNYYSNLKGEVYLKKTFKDSAICIHPKYDSRLITEVFTKDTIFLSPKPLLLEEIIVSAKPKISTYHLGYYDVKERFKNSGLFNEYSILATFIPNSYESVYIEKVLLSLKSKKYSESYNVYLFELDSLGKPGKILYKQNIIVDSLKEEGVIDISKLKIKLPEKGVFVGLENLKIYDLENKILFGEVGVRFDFTEKYEDTQTYILLNDMNKNPKSIWIEFIGPHEYFTPCFGLQVYQKNY